jgi:hypothetical protein
MSRPLPAKKRTIYAPTPAATAGRAIPRVSPYSKMTFVVYNKIYQFDLDLGREDMYTVLYNIRKVAREPRHSKEHRRNVRIGNTATR